MAGTLGAIAGQRKSNFTMKGSSREIPIVVVEDGPVVSGGVQLTRIPSLGYEHRQRDMGPQCRDATFCTTIERQKLWY